MLWSFGGGTYVSMYLSAMYCTCQSRRLYMISSSNPKYTSTTSRLTLLGLESSINDIVLK